MTSLLLKGSNRLTLFKRVSSVITSNNNNIGSSSNNSKSVFCINKSKSIGYSISIHKLLSNSSSISSSSSSNYYNNHNNNINKYNSRFYSQNRYANEFITEEDEIEMKVNSNSNSIKAVTKNQCSSLVKRYRMFETQLDEDTLNEIFDRYFVNSDDSQINLPMVLDFFRLKEFSKLSDNRYSIYIDVFFKWITEFMKSLDITQMEWFLKYYRRIKSDNFYKVLNYIEKHNIPHNIYTYNTTLLFYSENGQIGKAYELANIALSLDKPLNEKLYLSLLNAFRVDMQYVKRIHQKALNDPELGINSAVFNLIAQIYIKVVNRMDWAMDIVTLLQDNEVPVTHNTLVSILEYHIVKDPVAAYIFFKRFLVKNPNYLNGVENCNLIVPILIRGPPELFLEFVEHLKTQGKITREFFNAAINCYTRSKNRSIIIELYNNMITLFKPDPTTLKSLVFLSSQSNSLQEVMYWFDTVRQLGYDISPQMYGYTMRFLLRNKHFNELKPLIKEVREKKKYNDWIFVAIAMYNEITGATNTRFENDIQLMKNLNIDISHFSDLVVKEFLLMDDVPRAQLWMDKKPELGLRLTPYSFSLFLVYYEMRFNLKEFSEVLDRMQKAGFVRNLELEGRLQKQLSINYAKSVLPPPDYSQLSREKLDVIQTNKFRTTIQDLLKNRDFHTALVKLNERREKQYPIDMETYLLLLKHANRTNNQERTLELFTMILEQGYLPEKSIINQSLDLIHHLGKKQFDKFVERIPANYEQDFEEMLMALRIKWDFKNAIQLMMNNPEKYEYLFRSEPIRNALLRQLSVINELERATKLIEEMISQRQIFDGQNLDYFYKKITENEYYCPIINRMKDYYHRYKILASVDFYNAQLSNLYLENRIEEAFNLFHHILEQLKGVQHITSLCLEMGMKIYARHYPVPPLSNISQWETISTIAQENSIRDTVVQKLFYQSLRAAGQIDLIRENIKNQKYGRSIPTELAHLILECCESNEEVIRHAKAMLKHKQRLATNECLAILKKANQDIRDPTIEKYLMANKPHAKIQLNPLDKQELEFLDRRLLPFYHKTSHITNQYK